MKKDSKSAVIAIIISISILLIIGYGVNKFLIGRDGIISKVSNVESEFDKTEVLEFLTEKVKQKYMSVYNETKEAKDKKIEDLYNADICISSLVDQGAIEYYYYSSYDENSKKYIYILSGDISSENLKRDDIFWINTDIISDVKLSGRGSKYLENGELNYNDVFVLEKRVENDGFIYVITYYDSTGKAKDVGRLELAQPLTK